jgi:hypothetical protein
MKTLTFKIRRVEIFALSLLEFKTIKMKVVVIETLDLEVVNYHFLWYFLFKREG